LRNTGIAFALLALSALPVLAADWGRYENGRYAYSIDMPPGFPAIVEADNGDGGTARSTEGDAELAVWGTILPDWTLKEEVNQRIVADEDAGWRLAYSGGNDAGYSWSAVKGQRIHYARAIPLCEDEVAFFRLEYPAASKTAFDPIIKRLVRSFGSFQGCE
jgi:hypothetical protein